MFCTSLFILLFFLLLTIVLSVPTFEWRLLITPLVFSYISSVSFDILALLI
jgi:hypothetical protein